MYEYKELFSVLQKINIEKLYQFRNYFIIPKCIMSDVCFILMRVKFLKLNIDMITLFEIHGQFVFNIVHGLFIMAF